MTEPATKEYYKQEILDKLSSSRKLFLHNWAESHRSFHTQNVTVLRTSGWQSQPPIVRDFTQMKGSQINPRILWKLAGHIGTWKTPKCKKKKSVDLTNISLCHVSELFPRKWQWRVFGSLMLPIFTVAGLLGPAGFKGKPKLS